MEITRQNIEADLKPSAAIISDVKHLASYNWIDEASPTIAVPGSPPLWLPPAVARSLPKDAGSSYVDQNRARYPDSPFEPLLRALRINSPLFNLRKVDVITDRNSIRALLAFINPDADPEHDKALTIGLDVIGKTLFFYRREIEQTDFLPPHRKGYRGAFEKAYTQRQIDGSTGHYRIITYRFGGLQFVLRHGTNAFVAGPKTFQYSPWPEENHGRLTIRKEGAVISIDQTLELKTRSVGNPVELKTVAPKLWISQTPKLMRAYHDKGKFKTVRVGNIVSEVKTWETERQEDLRRLAVLIKLIVSKTRDLYQVLPEKHFYLRHDQETDRLVFEFESADWKMGLPDDLRSIWLTPGA